MSSAPSEEEVLAAILGGDAGESAKKTRKRKKKRGKGEEKAVDAEPGSGSGSAFEEELAWCVGQLELGLQRADAEQAKEVNKVLKVLRSEATPLVKKRFIMHKRFGNYRELMKTHRCRPGTRAPATIAMASKDR